MGLMQDPKPQLVHIMQDPKPQLVHIMQPFAFNTGLRQTSHLMGKLE